MLRALVEKALSLRLAVLGRDVLPEPTVDVVPVTLRTRESVS